MIKFMWTFIHKSSSKLLLACLHI